MYQSGIMNMSFTFVFMSKKVLYISEAKCVGADFYPSTRERCHIVPPHFASQAA